jgi:hypothetical protein
MDPMGTKPWLFGGFNHLEKSWTSSVGMMKFTIYGKIQKCSKPPTSINPYSWIDDHSQALTMAHMINFNFSALTCAKTKFPVSREVSVDNYGGYICSWGSKSIWNWGWAQVASQRFLVQERGVQATKSCFLFSPDPNRALAFYILKRNF